MGLGLLFYILLGFRPTLKQEAIYQQLPCPIKQALMLQGWRVEGLQGLGLS